MPSFSTQPSGVALEAGAREIMPLQNMFWGDRMGCVEDPFGHQWLLSQRVAEPTPEELRKGQEAFFSGAQHA
jgi:hypothetical protein